MHNSITNVVLVGLCGSGKSAIGRQLAGRLGFGFLDLDSWIEKSAGCPVARIFSDGGESDFRKKESEALSEIGGITGHVIALGGGTMQNSENRGLISDLGVTVWINIPTQMIAYRLSRNTEELKKRPLLAEIARETQESERAQALQSLLDRQLSERQEGFREAHLTFSDGFVSPDDAALRIRQQLDGREFQKSLRKRQKNKERLREKRSSGHSEGE